MTKFYNYQFIDRGKVTLELKVCIKKMANTEKKSLKKQEKN